MTQEEKAKAYDEALERANKELQACGSTDCDAAKQIFRFFPELKESEDEKIRKELISFLQSYDTLLTQKFIAWLEKQGSNLVENGYTDNKDIIKYADNYSHEIWHKLMDNFKNIKDYHIGCNDVSDIVLNAIIDAYNWIEKQGESIKIKKGKNYLCTKTHKYAGVEWIKGVKYYSPEDYSLVNQGCTCYCPKYSKEEHNNFFKEVEYDGCLEKQGEQNHVEWNREDEQNFNAALSYIDDEYLRRWLKDIIHFKYDKPIDKVHYKRGYDDGYLEGIVNAKQELEKQGEMDDIETDIEKPITIGRRRAVSGKLKELIDNKDPKSIEETKEKMLAETEPRFKVGDWCIDNEDGTIFQIVKVLDNTYTYKTNEGIEYSCTHYSLENDARLWSIQDAKDGDVLAEDSCIFIIQKFGKYSTAAKTYCTLYNDGDFNDGSILYFDIASTKPATKEQRELLFRKMKESGYEWDNEKKELKKIDNEIEIPFSAKDSELQEVTYYIPQGFHAEIDDDKVVFKKGKKPTAWSDEDERLLKATINTVLISRSSCEEDDEIKDRYDDELRWLKTIKDRVQPQPEQKWKEEDEIGFGDTLWAIDKARTIAKDENDMGNLWYAEDWLNSLKQRIGG